MPLKDPPGVPSGSADTPDEDRASILIVDDLPEKLLVFETVLQELGQHIVCVRSGSEALREVLQREFAVILLDVNMPDIDGLETAALIRKYKRSAHTPIIFVTSYADEMQTVRGYSLGAVDYILSPVVPEVLRSKVKVFVELHVLQRRLRRQADERVALAAANVARQAAEDATRRSGFLANASRALGGTLDFDLGMRRMLELVVPVLASSATLVLADAQQGVKLMSCRFDDEPGAMTSRAAIVFWSPHPEAPVQEMAAALGGDNDAALPDRLPAEQQIVPLMLSDSRIGALWVRDTERPIDKALLHELADRAAMTFENARLYRSLQVEIQERRTAEAQLQVANRRKDEFLAMLSHELRNPLAPIRNAIEIIRRVAPDDPKLAMAMGVTSRQVEHLTRLVDELLDVARISQGKIELKSETLDFRTAMEQGIETVRPLVDSLRHQLVVELPNTPVWLRGDPDRLAQVVVNLMHNAAKYTPEGGRIEATLALADGQAVMSIRDNGIGIEPEYLPKVFDLFEQGRRGLDRSQGGLGVGLALVQRLVQLHHGRVEAHSPGSGQGAEFRVLLPCFQDVSSSAGAKKESTDADADALRCRVLVVDDNRDAAETIALFLELEGHEVRAVGDAMQALECADHFAPDIAVLDIGLPQMDGYELARRLLAKQAGLFLIALTGYGQPEDMQATRQAGFHAHLVKPIDPIELLRLIEEWRANAPGLHQALQRGAISPVDNR